MAGKGAAPHPKKANEKDAKAERKIKMMKVSELLEILERLPKNAHVAVVEGDDYENKKTILSPYWSTDGEFVIQYWD